MSELIIRNGEITDELTFTSNTLSLTFPAGTTVELISKQMQLFLDEEVRVKEEIKKVSPERYHPKAGRL